MGIAGSGRVVVAVALKAVIISAFTLLSTVLLLPFRFTYGSKELFDLANFDFLGAACPCIHRWARLDVRVQRLVRR